MGLRDEIRRMRLQEWGKIIQDRLDSGLTIDKYCKEHSISRDSYMYWLRQLRTAEIVRQDCLFTELVVPDAQNVTNTQSPITITVGKGTITVQDKESLRLVMEILLNA